MSSKSFLDVVSVARIENASFSLLKMIKNRLLSFLNRLIRNLFDIEIYVIF